jgi:hypothetical protein
MMGSSFLPFCVSSQLPCRDFYEEMGSLCTDTFPAIKLLMP